MTQEFHRYGWKPDLPDKRDLLYMYKAPPKVAKNLPPLVDLRPEMPLIWDQGDLGSCTANATGAQLWHLELKKAPEVAFEPSRLFHYYATRMIEGTTKEDSGAFIRDSIKAAVRTGYCPEKDWPYNVAKFARKPARIAFKDATKCKVSKYHRVPQAPGQLKSVLALGHTINFGFTVYESFESDSIKTTGIMPMPGPDEAVLGGHAVLIVGYDDENKWYIVRNSWGTDWGAQGYFYMPYDFAHDKDYADDFWTIDAP